MQKLNFLVVGLFIVGVTAAVAEDARFRFDSSTDFSKYKTYKWVAIRGAPHANQAVEKEITEAVDGELAKKGLIRTDADTVDLFIGYLGAIGTEEFTAPETDWGGGSFTIHTGQVVLEMYDPARKKLVWLNTVSKIIDPNANPEKRQKNITKAMSKLLGNYPPKKK
jgi:hypothetical protein